MSSPKELIHLTGPDPFGQPDIQILCTREWTTAGWGKDAIYRDDLGLGGGIYRAENNKLYTFANPVATCPECIDQRLTLLKEQTQKRLERYRKEKQTKKS